MTCESFAIVKLSLKTQFSNQVEGLIMNIEMLLALAEELQLRQIWQEALCEEQEKLRLRLAA